MKVGSLITGILYAISFAALFFFLLVLGIAFGLGEAFSNSGSANADIIITCCYLSVPLAITSLVASILVMIKPKGARVLFVIVDVIYIAIMVASIVITKGENFSWLLFIVPLILGALATTFAFLAKQKIKEQKVETLSAEESDLISGEVYSKGDDSFNE